MHLLGLGFETCCVLHSLDPSKPQSSYLQNGGPLCFPAVGGCVQDEHVCHRRSIDVVFTIPSLTLLKALPSQTPVLHFTEGETEARSSETWKGP